MHHLNEALIANWLEMLDDNIARKGQLIADVAKDITDLIVAINWQSRADLSKPRGKVLSLNPVDTDLNIDSEHRF